jgi:CheY-like chemotaxis protein
LDAGVIQPELRDFRLSPYLERISNDYLLEAQTKGLQFERRVSDVVVHSDPQLLESIVRNYLANAVRYTDVGCIVLRTLVRQDGVLIEVADTGRGIPREFHTSIFREFFQLENPERDRTKGLGLGLAMVERLGRLLNTPIGLDSEPGRGSVFSVLVPAGDLASVEDGSTDAADTASNDVSGLLVLIVEDDSNVRRSMASLLTLWGCEVLDVGSEAEAIERLRALGRAPDAVIVDYRLREQRSGAQAIRSIHEIYGDAIPALIVTGDTARDRLAEATASGYQLVHKPVSPTILNEFLRSCLRA